MGILMDVTDVDLANSSYQRRAVAKPEVYSEMGAPSDTYYADTMTVITREAERGNVAEQIREKSMQHLPPNQTLNGYVFTPCQRVAPVVNNVTITKKSVNLTDKPSGSKNDVQSDQSKEASQVTRPPPKKKWIKEYLEKEPKSQLSVRLVTPTPPRCNGVVRAASPVPTVVAVADTHQPPAPLHMPHDFTQEHSRPRTSSNHGPPSIPSPPSVGSNGSAGSSGSNGSVPRAGTREVHNKLEKNRRAHLKECFELLKRQLPSTSDDKKTSNLSILGSAIRYIQVLKRKERECEHELERLAREKIAAQQRLAALKREAAAKGIVRPRSAEGVNEEKDREDRVNGKVLGIPISITSPAASPPRTLNLSTKLRTLPIQITPTTSQVVRTTYGGRHNTLTLTTLAPASQNGQIENGVVTSALSTTLVHPAQIHLPISQMVGSGGLVVGAGALQLLSAPGLRVLQAPALHANGMTTGDKNRLPRENGIISAPSTEGGSVVVGGLTPLVVSQPGAHLLHTHTLTHKMVESQIVKGGVAPLTVSAQYLSATAIVKPVVVVTSADGT